MGSDTRYTARFLGPTVIQRGQEQVLSCPVYLAGSLVIPTGGTIVIYDGSNQVLLNESISVAGSIATYTLLAAITSGLQPEDGWRVEWTLILSGISHIFRNDAVLVYRRLYPVIADSDLYQLQNSLSRRMPTGITSWQAKIDAAWGEIESRLLEGGLRPWLILSPSALRRAHLSLTLCRIFDELSQGNAETQEAKQADSYRQEYQSAWANLTFPQADPTTGQDGQPGRRKSHPTIWLCSR